MRVVSVRRSTKFAAEISEKRPQIARSRQAKCCKLVEFLLSYSANAELAHPFGAQRGLPRRHVLQEGADYYCVLALLGTVQWVQAHKFLTYFWMSIQVAPKHTWGDKHPNKSRMLKWTAANAASTKECMWKSNDHNRAHRKVSESE